MKKLMTGKQAILETLKEHNIQHIFGNPGTSEGPLIDMLGDYPNFKYIMALQESVAMGMGESFARSTNSTGFVSLHVDSGLANGIALMLDALNTGTPLVVTSANYDSRKINETKTDLAELVRPVTKWAVELDLPDQIPSALRRAFNEANSHPKGPVYVGFTSNALEGMAEMTITGPSQKFDNVLPDPKAIQMASEKIINSQNPVLILGDRASDDQANNEAVEFAELLGLPVFQSRGAEISFPSSHPQYMGIHTLRSKENRDELKNHDLIIAIGMDPFDELFYWGDVILEDNSNLIHIDPIYSRIGKSEPTYLGIVSNCKHALSQLIQNIKTKTPNQFTERKSNTENEVQNRRNAYKSSVESQENWDSTPMSPARMMYEISKALPINAIVVDDAISNRGALRNFIRAEKRDDLRGVRGQSIGGGIGATMGTQCAFPDQPVFGIIGDGSAMMTIQGLWTAANDKIPCKFIICNNGMYRVLKVNFNIYQKDVLDLSETAGENLLYSNFDTPFNITEIAQGMGITSERITDPSQIDSAIKRATEFNGPYLLDIVIDGSL
ncbi:MAG: thiamine pyrophosphate-binding protein [SAR202 cluster bacterium]|nr:thiamine pyrophosphate-binding protein [SAR202 cluster bacterium]